MKNLTGIMWVETFCLLTLLQMYINVYKQHNSVESLAVRQSMVAAHVFQCTYFSGLEN